jgi:hypothetical protein
MPFGLIERCWVGPRAEPSRGMWREHSGMTRVCCSFVLSVSRS